MCLIFLFVACETETVAQYADRVRGPLNEGGLYGERQGETVLIQQSGISLVSTISSG